MPLFLIFISGVLLKILDIFVAPDLLKTPMDQPRFYALLVLTLVVLVVASLIFGKGIVDLMTPPKKSKNKNQR